MKALIAPPVPNSMPCSMSRTKPAMRDSRVIALNTALDRSNPLMPDGVPPAPRRRYC